MRNWDCNGMYTNRTGMREACIQTELGWQKHVYQQNWDGMVSNLQTETARGFKIIEMTGVGF